MEQSALIDRIEQVKSKIAEFEKELNITAMDLDKITIGGESSLIKQISDYKKRIDNIESDLAKNSVQGYESQFLSNQKKENYSDETANNQNPYEVDLKIKQELPSKKAAGVISKPPEKEQVKSGADGSVKETINKVKAEADEVENINNLLDKLKKNIGAVKNTAQQPGQIKENKYDNKQINSSNNVSRPEVKSFVYQQQTEVKRPEIQKTDKPKEVSSVVSAPQVKITENDLHSMSELISKLDELLRSNKEITDKLNGLLKLQDTHGSNSSRSSELIKRLAVLGANSGLK